MTNTAKFLSANNGIADLPVRLGLGTVFVAHGAQKLFGWFGGYGLEGTGQWMASIGLEPGYLMALAAGSAEFFGGILIVLGLATRLAATAAAVTMVVAITAVHLENGFFMSNGGYEFGLVLLLMAVAMMISGAGRLSADRLLFGKQEAR